MTGPLDPIWPVLVLVAGCGIISYVANGLLMPLYRRYALARPNARSSHKVPTPQGGGVGLMIGMAIGLLPCAALWPESQLGNLGFAALGLGALGLACSGALDDIFELPVAPRILVQAAAAALAAFATIPAGTALMTWPLALITTPVCLLAMIWFVNLTNFMDGIDGITIAEFVPMGCALIITAGIGFMPHGDGLIAGALTGALLGFAPYNKHIARLFLGDVGSLPIGLVAGALLMALAFAGQPVAALTLPLYYLADATITLLRRLARGDNVTKAHRTHFYQRATDHGWTVPAITRVLWLVNGALAALALASLEITSAGGRLLVGLAALDLVARTLSAFSRAPTP